jgi:hypothetical protein
MSSPLHIKKIEILTRLVKEKLVSLNEALILLQDENLEEQSYDFIINDSSYWSSNSSNHKIKFDDNSTNF